jgi:hypothetical protein
MLCMVMMADRGTPLAAVVAHVDALCNFLGVVIMHVFIIRPVTSSLVAVLWRAGGVAARYRKEMCGKRCTFQPGSDQPNERLI